MYINQNNTLLVLFQSGGNLIVTDFSMNIGCYFFIIPFNVDGNNSFKASSDILISNDEYTWTS